MQTVLRYFRIAVYPLVVCFIVAQAPKTAFAQGEHEHVSVTTYYPSPKGNFNELAIGANLYFDNYAAISHKTRGDVVTFSNYEYYVDLDLDGVEERYTRVVIAFMVPVKFEQGVTFDTDSHVIFWPPPLPAPQDALTLIVNGDVIVYKALIANALIPEIGLTAPNITADSNITAGAWGGNPGILSGAEVVDMNLGYFLGASLAELYDEDVAVHIVNAAQQIILNAFTLVLDLI